MLNGVFPITFVQLFGLVLLLTHITIAAVTLFLHRSQAHRALTFHPVVSHFFRAWLWMTTGMETKVWVSIHRKHHAKCETHEDPHSPQVLGLKMVLLEGAELYRKEKADKVTQERYGQGTPNDWLEKKLYSRAPGLGIFILLFIELILFGAKGLTLWAVQMAWIPFFAAGIINGIGHFWGYRNFESPDAARNISPIGLLIGGEELHNNHHAYPTSARLSLKWFEFDIGWIYIQTLSLFGLAQVRRSAPVVQLNAQAHISPATLKALLSNRVQVMTHYTQTIVKPALKKALKHAKGPQKQALLALKKSLKQNTPTFDPSCLQGFPQLEQVLGYKEKLQTIWDARKATQEQLIHSLENWCRRAQDTQGAALVSFAEYLARYQLKSA